MATIVLHAWRGAEKAITYSISGCARTGIRTPVNPLHVQKGRDSSRCEGTMSSSPPIDLPMIFGAISRSCSCTARAIHASISPSRPAAAWASRRWSMSAQLSTKTPPSFESSHAVRRAGRWPSPKPPRFSSLQQSASRASICSALSVISSRSSPNWEPTRARSKNPRRTTAPSASAHMSRRQ
eukprot:5861340-Prymnesium_polylepis.1